MINFKCPKCGTTKSIEKWGEYPYSWQLLSCYKCNTDFPPKGNQIDDKNSSPAMEATGEG